MKPKLLGCLILAMFFLTTAVQADIVLTVFFEVKDLVFDYPETIPSMSRTSIKATIRTIQAYKEYSVIFLKPLAEVIEIANESAIIGRTDCTLVSYQEPGKTVIRIISGTAKIPILLPANADPEINGADVEKGKIVCRMTVDADPTKTLELKLQYGNGRVVDPFLFLPGSSGCSTVQKTEQSGELIYRVTPGICKPLSLFPMDMPLQTEFNTVQVSQTEIMIGKNDTIYRYSLPVEKPRLIAKAVQYQRMTYKQYGDFNGDGGYDYKDIQAIGMKFGQKGNFIMEDVNDDGIVNVLDLVVLSKNLSKTAAAPPGIFQKSTYTATTWGDLKK